jgi:hypothetical protein
MTERLRRAVLCCALFAVFVSLASVGGDWVMSLVVVALLVVQYGLFGLLRDLREQGRNLAMLQDLIECCKSSYRGEDCDPPSKPNH